MTEEKEVYSSIFDAASKVERKKALQKVLEEVKEGQIVASETKAVMTNEEISQRYEQCKQLHHLIADRLEEVFVKNNLTPGKLHDYFDSPKNFTSSQWQLIEEQKQTVQQMLTKLLPHAIQQVKVERSEEDKRKEKRPTKMQVKSRWIPMR